MFVIETVGAEEAEILAGTVRAAFEEYRGGLVPPSGALADTAEGIARRLEKGWAAVAREEGTAGRSVAGCILCERRDDSVYLGRLAVLPRWRGHGAAGLLLAHAEAAARLAGAARLTLNVRLALPGNIGFFARRGFHEVGRLSHPGFDEATFCVMEKPLR
jgi:GNAT superfamily N-acetyltransferase